MAGWHEACPYIVGWSAGAKLQKRLETAKKVQEKFGGDGKMLIFEPG